MRIFVYQLVPWADRLDEGSEAAAKCGDAEVDEDADGVNPRLLKTVPWSVLCGKRTADRKLGQKAILRVRWLNDRCRCPRLLIITLIDHLSTAVSKMTGMKGSVAASGTQSAALGWTLDSQRHCARAERWPLMPCSVCGTPAARFILHLLQNGTRYSCCCADFWAFADA